MRKYPVLNFIAAGCLCLAGLGCFTYTETGPGTIYIETKSAEQADPKAEIQPSANKAKRDFYKASAENELKEAENDFEGGKCFSAHLHIELARGYCGLLRENLPKELLNLEGGVESCLKERAKE